MKKYPSIEQLRTVIKEVRFNHDFKGKDELGNPIYLHTTPYPVLKFKGTVKLHGTNASIVKYSDDRIEYQSRERVLSLDDDNSGFMNEMVKKDLSYLFDDIKFNDYCAIYGEWCGGNIQKGVAINGLPKMFVIFGIKVDDNWLTDYKIKLDKNNSIYDINQFETYEIEIDFNEPEYIQNHIIELTNKVEQQCPVGKYFGNEGIGEGIVFTCLTNPHYRFKSKGEKHSVSKIKTLKIVDTEKLESIKEFVEYSVTENRLQQGLSYFIENNIEIDIKNIGVFLRWIVNDIHKEENDVITENNLDEKMINKSITNKAKDWFIKNY